MDTSLSTLQLILRRYSLRAHPPRPIHLTIRLNLILNWLQQSVAHRMMQSTIFAVRRITRYLMPNVSERQLNEWLELFGRQVKSVREIMELSQEDFATRCGWDRTRQSKIESGSYNLTIESLIAIGNASKMNLDINYTSR